MYGRMQFADYVVTYALQILNRCLLKVQDGALSVSRFGKQEGSATLESARELRVALAAELNLLADNVEKLVSLWQLVQWSVGKLQYRQAQARLQEILSLVSMGANIELLGAEQLSAAASDPKVRKAVDKALQALAPRSRQVRFSRPRRDRLNWLLQEESASWRDYAALRQIADPEIITHGMGRAYEKGQSLLLALEASAKQGARPPALKRLRRAHRWVRHCVHHHELLQPALSESGKVRRWHLERLNSKLEQQYQLECFARAAQAMTFKAKTQNRLVELVDSRRKHIDKQRNKLRLGAFAGSQDVFREDVATTVTQLGLGTITLLPLEMRKTGLSGDL